MFLLSLSKTPPLSSSRGFSPLRSAVSSLGPQPFCVPRWALQMPSRITARRLSLGVPLTLVRVCANPPAYSKAEKEAVLYFSYWDWGVALVINAGKWLQNGRMAAPSSNFLQISAAARSANGFWGNPSINQSHDWMCCLGIALFVWITLTLVSPHDFTFQFVHYNVSPASASMRNCPSDTSPLKYVSLTQKSWKPLL